MDVLFDRIQRRGLARDLLLGFGRLLVHITQGFGGNPKAASSRNCGVNDCFHIGALTNKRVGFRFSRHDGHEFIYCGCDQNIPHEIGWIDEHNFATLA